LPQEGYHRLSIPWDTLIRRDVHGAGEALFELRQDDKKNGGNKENNGQESRQGDSEGNFIGYLFHLFSREMVINEPPF
jgi:hypothetical protein